MLRSSNSYDVTVIIPVYNRAEALRTVVPSYLRSRLVKRLILVDDASTDDTPNVMAELSKTNSTPIEIIRGKVRGGAPAARNLGVPHIDTEWALMGEDDVYLGDIYIDVLYRQAHELKADIIAGRLLNIPIPGSFSPALLQDNQGAVNADHAQIFDLSIFSMEFSARPERPVAAPFLHSVVLVHRRVFERVQYDPSYGGNGVREETDFYLAAAAAGFSLYFTPDTVCYHLRGPIANCGGQRMPRWKMEYWNIVNTYRLVSKHWQFLCERHGFRGTPLRWMLRYVWQRYRHVMRHALRQGTLQPKNRL